MTTPTDTPPPTDTDALAARLREAAENRNINGIRCRDVLALLAERERLREAVDKLLDVSTFSITEYEECRHCGSLAWESPSDHNETCAWRLAVEQARAALSPKEPTDDR